MVGCRFQHHFKAYSIVDHCELRAFQIFEKSWAVQEKRRGELCNTVESLVTLYRTYNGLSAVLQEALQLLQEALRCVTGGSPLCYKRLSAVLQEALSCVTRGSPLCYRRLSSVLQEVLHYICIHMLQRFVKVIIIYSAWGIVRILRLSHSTLNCSQLGISVEYFPTLLYTRIYLEYCPNLLYRAQGYL